MTRHQQGPFHPHPVNPDSTIPMVKSVPMVNSSLQSINKNSQQIRSRCPLQKYQIKTQIPHRPFPHTFLSKTRGGRNEDDSNEENFNFSDVDTIQDDATQNEKLITCQELIKKQKQCDDFNQNNWKVRKHCKYKLNQVKKFIKSPTDDHKGVLYYKYFQASDHYHSVAHQTLSQ
jgi:hypothetical protein